MNVTGTDLDPDQLQIARSKHSEGDRLRFELADATRLPYEDESFDLLICHNVFHHMPTWKATVPELARVLRPDGYLFWMDLVSPPWIRTLLLRLVRNHGFYTKAEIRSAFWENGFTELFHECLEPGPVSHHHLVLRRE